MRGFIVELLRPLGEDPEREGLEQTPTRKEDDHGTRRHVYSVVERAIRPDRPMQAAVETIWAMRADVTRCAERDGSLQRRGLAWRRVAAGVCCHLLGCVLSRLPRPRRGWTIAGIVAALVWLSGSWPSGWSVPPAIAANAAPAGSPFSPSSRLAEARPRAATLPPLLSTDDVASVMLTASDATVAVVDEMPYQAWTFGNTVPGPVLHLRQGQRIHVTFINHGTLPHSLDLHAAEVPPAVAYRDVAPGEMLDFSFVARTPGVFVYHCGTAPVLLHTANGMYGAMVVDPVQPLPPADVSYVLVQSEWYTRQLRERLLAGDVAKMQAVTPDYVAFNGIAFQYQQHPLMAKAGQRIRLYLANVGPSLPSAFHVIGAMFAAVYPDGDAAHALTGISTYLVAPGQGVVFDLIIPQAGTYPFVDHSLRDQLIGAVGVLDVAP